MSSKKKQPKFLFTVVIVAAINTPRCIIDRKDCNICVLRIVNLGQSCKQNYSKIEKKKTSFLIQVQTEGESLFICCESKNISTTVIMAAINTPRYVLQTAKIAMCDLQIVNHCPSHTYKIAPNLHFEEVTCISVNQFGSLARTTTKAIGTNS